MTTRIGLGTRNAAIDAGIGVAFDTVPKIAVYTGAQPATADTAASGTLLATLTPTNGDMFAAASGGAAAANAIASVAAAASGLPGYIRVYRNGDTAPGTIATSTDRRMDMAAGVRSTLPAGINASVTTITFASASGFPASGAVFIDSEIITYTGISTNDLTGCTRGTSGTTAATHATSAVVYQNGVEVTFDNAQFVSGGVLAGGTVSMSSLTVTQPA